MFLSFIIFIGAVLFTFYLPGRFLLRVIGYQQQENVIVTASSFAVGITSFLFMLYCFSWIGMPILVTILFFLLAFFEFRLVFLAWKKKDFNIHIVTFENFLLLVGSVAMVSVMWKSGLSTQEGLTFYAINATDGMFHLSLIGSLTRFFPPVHPGLADIPLRGYHFFYDLLIANFITVYNLNKMDLFFRFFPFFIALFYGLSGLSLARFLHFSSLSTRFFLFLLYFAQGFTFFLGYFLEGSYDNTIIQSIAHSVDPNVIFSVALLFSLFVVLFYSKSIKQFVFVGILIGIMPTIKIYTAVILFGALFFVSCSAWIKNRDEKFFIAFIVACIVASFVYFPLNYGAGQLIFAPFLLYKHFIESSSMFTNMNWGLQYQIFESHNNYLRIAFLYIQAMVLFFIPTLGIRLITLAYIPKLFRKRFYTLPNVFWATAIVITFIIPTFFIQSVAVFVVVQFFWFGYIILLLPTAYILGNILKDASTLVVFFVAILLVLLSIPDTFNTIKTYSEKTHEESPYIISTEKVALMKAIQTHVPPTNNLLVLNRTKKTEGYTDMYEMPLISGLTNRLVYYEPEVLEFKNVEHIVQNRKETIDTIQEITYTSCDNSAIGVKQLKDILQETNTQYIVSLEPNTCLDTMPIVKKIFYHGAVALYKIL